MSIQAPAPDTSGSSSVTVKTQDTDETRAMLALSVLERMSHRDRPGIDRAAFIALIAEEARMALDGCTLEQITSFHLRKTA